MMGALSVKLPNGVTFSIGTGFTDKQRKKPPKIGTVITFKYQELSDSGHPRYLPSPFIPSPFPFLFDFQVFMFSTTFYFD